MELSVKTVAMIALSLIIISGIFVVLQSLFGDTTNEVDDTSEDAGEGLNCVLDNMEDAEKCKEGLTEESSLEVQYTSEEIPI